MTKAVTQEGFYHCEGKFDFSQSREGETEKESSEELVEEMGSCPAAIYQEFSD